jgi:hypothetical protein
MRNKILINLAIKILSFVNQNNIQYKNSWKHYNNKIGEFLEN